MIHLGHIQELAFYPVKSMAGIPAKTAFLGWHGLQGDRRFAFRRLDADNNFPWLTASRLPELLLYEPLGIKGNDPESLPTEVRTPDGMIYPLRSEALKNHVANKFGSPVELMNIKHGIFDDATISLIGHATVAAICREAALQPDTRRFRANIVIKNDSEEPFLEDSWIGGRIVFGDRETGPMISVTLRDLRCMMINLDPDTARQDPGMMKAAVRMNDNFAGVYGTVIRTGYLAIGQTVRLILENGDG